MRPCRRRPWTVWAASFRTAPRAVWVLSALVLGALLAGSASATPLLALKESENCAGCHDGGRRQRPILLRRCTLDCAGCHIDPAGGGPRNQWGYYYSHAALNAFHFQKPIDPLKDESRFDLHYDGRVIQRQAAAGSRMIPMSSEFSVRVRPFVEYLHLTYQGLYFGRIGESRLSLDHGDERRFQEKYSIMVDQLPLGMYVRYYRGQPMYGLRRPNHSLWIRERIGLDQFALTDAYEIGGTPTVPFFRYSVMSGDPNAEPEDRQAGTSFHGGMRGVTLGWHVNGSLWKTKSKKAAIDMKAVGAGLKPWKFLLYGERNWREVEVFDDPEGAEDFASQALKLHPSSKIEEWTAAFAGIPGVITGVVYEELEDAERSSARRSIFLDLHPFPFLQMEVWRRFETGTRTLADTLLIAHLYADF